MQKIHQLFDPDSGVSPVIGVILMVAITVAIVALLTVIVFDISENSVGDSPDISLNTEISQGTDSISISVYRNENVDRIYVIGNGVNGRQTVIDSPNDIGSVTISPTDSDGYIKIIGITDGTSQVIKKESYKGFSGDGLGVTEDIVSLDLRFNSSSDEIEANVTENNGADRVFIRGDGINGEENIVTSPTDTGSITIKPNSESGSVEAIAESDKTQELIDKVSYSGVSTVSSSEPSSNAPNCGTVTYNGSGTLSDPYNITNDHELQCMRSDLSSNYQLTRHIDASLTDQWNSGSGFQPIGTGFSNGYSGSFNGQGYEIRNITIDRDSTKFIGVFGYTDAGSEIKNVGVTNATVIGQTHVGILLGYGYQTVVNNTYSTGSIESRDTASFPYAAGGLVGNIDEGRIEDSYSAATVIGQNDVGGLVGVNGNGVITKSYATGNVQSYKDDTGGLVGYLNGNLSRSFATGDVMASGADNRNAGGLVGQSTGFNNVINKSYATGSVTGDEQVGGLVGNNNLALSNSYSTGSVSGSTSIGGLVGSNAGSVSSSYWDTVSSGQNSSGGGATGLTTSEMQGSVAETNMTAFDFSSDWVTVSGDYPVSAYIDQQIQLNSR
jgi:flagellin-like protein